MGCNCNKKNTSKGFVYIAPSGVKKTYSTEVEAKAAQIRAGGTGAVQPA